jgi:hypothetical protein
MIISKQGLMVVHTTKADDKIPALNNIHIARDGSTVGIGGKMFLAVSPISDKVRKKIGNIFEEKGTIPDKGLTVNADSIKDILKYIPSDRAYGGLLEHCNIEPIKDDERKCRFTMTDGKERTSKTGKLYTRAYLEYKRLFAEAMKTCTADEEATPGNKRIVLNLKRLIVLLEAIAQVAPDSSGDNPVWVEFTKDNYIVIRAINMTMDQRAIGIMMPFTGVEGKWLEPNEWERGYLPSVRNDNKDKVMKHKQRTIKHKRKD